MVTTWTSKLRPSAWDTRTGQRWPRGRSPRLDHFNRGAVHWIPRTATEHYCHLDGLKQQKCGVFVPFWVPEIRYHSVDRTTHPAKAVGETPSCLFPLLVPPWLMAASARPLPPSPRAFLPGHSDLLPFCLLEEQSPLDLGPTLIRIDLILRS